MGLDWHERSIHWSVFLRQKWYNTRISSITGSWSMLRNLRNIFKNWSRVADFLLNHYSKMDKFGTIRFFFWRQIFWYMIILCYSKLIFGILFVSRYHHHQAASLAQLVSSLKCLSTAKILSYNTYFKNNGFMKMVENMRNAYENWLKAS